MNVQLMGNAANSSSLMYPGSPLDFAQNYLNPSLAGISNQVNGLLGSLPPPGTAGAPGTAAPAQGGGLFDAVKHIAGGGIVGGIIGGIYKKGKAGGIPGAIAGGVIGGISSIL